MNFLELIIGILVGGVIGFLIALLRKKDGGDNPELLNQLTEYKNQLLEVKAKNEGLNANLVKLEGEKGGLSGRLEHSIETFKKQNSDLVQLREYNTKLQNELANANASTNSLSEKLNSQKADLENLQKKFTTEFENIANKILDEKSEKFTAQNKLNLGEILNPFNEKIKDFEKKVDDTYIKGTKDRAELFEQIKTLSDLNQQMRSDAQNLTKALKGDNKAQGNWGEFILEKILESSGLIKGEEYETQHSTQNIDGQRIQPDILIKLPDNKHIIIDSKVSLVAYESYVNSESKEEQEAYLKNHITSIKAHIKGLSEKNYHTAGDLNTPDFVLLFIPIESSFSLAIRSDKDLYAYAWNRKIVIVSPSTLLATLRTISSVWKQERQNKNALEIARQAGALYDKFVGFLEDMNKIEKSINDSKKAYDNALNKLQHGRGNLIRSTEKIRELGAKTNKQIQDKFIQDSTNSIE